VLVKYPIRERLATYRSTVTWNRGQVFKLTYPGRRRPANPIRLGVIMMSPSPPSPSRSLLVLVESGHGHGGTVTETTPSRWLTVTVTVAAFGFCYLYRHNLISWKS